VSCAWARAPGSWVSCCLTSPHAAAACKLPRAVHQTLICRGWPGSERTRHPSSARQPAQWECRPGGALPSTCTAISPSNMSAFWPLHRHLHPHCAATAPAPGAGWLLAGPTCARLHCHVFTSSTSRSLKHRPLRGSCRPQQWVHQGQGRASGAGERAAAAASPPLPAGLRTKRQAQRRCLELAWPPNRYTCSPTTVRVAPARALMPTLQCRRGMCEGQPGMCWQQGVLSLFLGAATCPPATCGVPRRAGPELAQVRSSLCWQPCTDARPGTGRGRLCIAPHGGRGGAGVDPRIAACTALRLQRGAARTPMSRVQRSSKAVALRSAPPNSSNWPFTAAQAAPPRAAGAKPSVHSWNHDPSMARMFVEMAIVVHAVVAEEDP